MNKYKNIITPGFKLKSDLLKNTSILISGTVLAQLIYILLQPVLRRYYTPEMFGAFNLYLSLVGILLVVSSFKYELAILLPKNDKVASNIFFLSAFLNLIFNIFLFITIYFFKNKLKEFLNIPSGYTNYLYIVPLGTFLVNFYQSINYWLIRKKAFIAISKNKFVRRSIEGVSQVGFKIFQFPQGLIIGDIVGHIANLGFGIYQSVKYGLKIRYFSYYKIKYVLFKYKDYPRFNLIPAFLSAGSYLLPSLFINKFYTIEDLGYFDLSKAVLSVPLALIATSISNVLLEKISVKYRKKVLFVKELLQVAIIVTAIGLLEVVVIRFYGESLFKWVFGSEWGISGEISQILVWSYALNFIIGSYSSVFIAMGKIKILSVWQLFYFGSILCLVFFYKFTFINFLRIYVLIEVVCYCSMILLIIFTIRNYTIKIRN